MLLRPQLQRRSSCVHALGSWGLTQTCMVAANQPHRRNADTLPRGCDPNPSAGVASLLAVYLHNRGLPVERLQCWAYETPACMDLALAHACSGGAVRDA